MADKRAMSSAGSSTDVPASNSVRNSDALGSSSVPGSSSENNSYRIIENDTFGEISMMISRKRKLVLADNMPPRELIASSESNMHQYMTGHELCCIPQELALKVFEDDNDKWHSHEIKFSKQNVGLYSSPYIYLSGGGVMYPERKSYSLRMRKKPLECDSVLVCGFPKKSTPALIEEIFEKCGSVKSIKFIRKGVYKVSFSDESSVKKAIGLSGYRLKIGNRSEDSYSGIICVDYPESDFGDKKDEVSAVPNKNNSEKETHFLGKVNPSEKNKQSVKKMKLSQEKNDSKSNAEENDRQIHLQDPGCENFCICSELRIEEDFLKLINEIITKLMAFTAVNPNMIITHLHCLHNYILDVKEKKEQYQAKYSSRSSKRILKAKFEDILSHLRRLEFMYTKMTENVSWGKLTATQRKNGSASKNDCRRLLLEIKDRVSQMNREMEVNEEIKIRQILGRVVTKYNKNKTLSGNMSALRDCLRSLELVQNRESRRVAAAVAEVQKQCQDFANDETVSESLRREFLQHLQPIDYEFGAQASPREEQEKQIMFLVVTHLEVFPGSTIEKIYITAKLMDSTLSIADLERLMRKSALVFEVDAPRSGRNSEKVWFAVENVEFPW